MPDRLDAHTHTSSSLHRYHVSVFKILTIADSRPAEGFHSKRDFHRCCCTRVFVAIALFHQDTHSKRDNRRRCSHTHTNSYAVLYFLCNVSRPAHVKHVCVSQSLNTFSFLLKYSITHSAECILCWLLRCVNNSALYTGASACVLFYVNMFLHRRSTRPQAHVGPIHKQSIFSRRTSLNPISPLLPPHYHLSLYKCIVL